MGVLIIVPFLSEAHKDPFVKFHIKQGVALIVFEIVGFFVGAIPVLGWLIGWLIWLAALVFIIVGITNAASGSEKMLPVIGPFATDLSF